MTRWIGVEEFTWVRTGCWKDAFVFQLSLLPEISIFLLFRWPFLWFSYVLPPSPLQPHAHNLDGFFVAKLKVSPRTKHQKAKNASKSKKVDDEDEEEAAVTGIEDDEVSEEEDEEAGEKTKGPFDDEEDEEIMKRSREKLERKRKRNVKGKGKAEKEPVEN